jgi:hypothetical protein
MKKVVYIGLLILMANQVMGQTLLGTTGYLNIPSADMQEDGTFFFGGSYIDKAYIDNYGGGDHNALTYYLNLTFLPFFEASFGSTRLLNLDSDRNTMDRRFSFRFRPLRERKYVPAIVIGAHDVYTSVSEDLETNQYFSSLYIVATKNIPLKGSEFGLTLGYGIDAFRNNQFLGLFGGVSFSPGFYRPMKFIAEYDGQGLNLGINAKFFNHLFVYAMLNDLTSFSGGIAYHVYLLNEAKKKRKAKKSGQR